MKLMYIDEFGVQIDIIECNEEKIINQVITACSQKFFDMSINQEENRFNFKGELYRVDYFNNYGYVCSLCIIREYYDNKKDFDVSQYEAGVKVNELLKSINQN